MTTKRNEEAVSGAQHGVMGDMDSPVNLPQTQVAQEVMDEERQMAAYAEHSEFLRLKRFLEGRKEFFSRHLPDGRRMQDVSKEERDQYWVAACVIVGEIEGILSAYEQAKESVRGRENA